MNKIVLYLNIFLVILDVQIKVITKLPNSEQSYKGKVKTHKYINRQNQTTTTNKAIPVCLKAKNIDKNIMYF
jgi:hypothetical protein